MTVASQPVGPGEAPSRMLQLLNSFVTVQALHVAAALGISDLLADGPMTLDDLAGMSPCKCGNWVCGSRHRRACGDV